MTEKLHWTNETADAAVQAAIEARALMLTTARALGLADEDVEQAPQRAAELVARLHAMDRDRGTSTDIEDGTR